MKLALEESMKEDDMVVESNNVKVVFSKNLQGHVKNTVIDYSDKWYARGFRLLGTSFGSCI